MILRIAGALAALCLSTSAAQTTVPASTLAHYPQVKQVICAKSRGSAVRIGNDTFISVTHVTTNSGCSIDGEPITVTYSDGGLDFSILRTARPGRGLEIDCGGFVPGEYYFATGFAYGWPIQTTILIRSTSLRSFNGLAILYGPQTVIPGQSGGALLNAAGKIVGVVNAYNPVLLLSFSRALKDTPLCHQ